MREIIKLNKNSANKGIYCIFEYNDQLFYADLAFVYDVNCYECMIFAADYEDGEYIVSNWHNIYCKRYLSNNTKETLLKCIDEFCQTLS